MPPKLCLSMPIAHPSNIIPVAFQNKAPFSLRQTTSSSSLRSCDRVVAAKDVGMSITPKQTSRKQLGPVSRRILDAHVQRPLSAASG